MSYFDDFEKNLTRAYIILASMGFEVDNISPIKYDSNDDTIIFRYIANDGTSLHMETLQADLTNRKWRYEHDDIWGEWEDC